MFHEEKYEMMVEYGVPTDLFEWVLCKNNNSKAKFSASEWTHLTKRAPKIHEKLTRFEQWIKKNYMLNDKIMMIATQSKKFFKAFIEEICFVFLNKWTKFHCILYYED